MAKPPEMLPPIPTVGRGAPDISPALNCGPWKKTGAARFRRRFYLGPLRLMIEEQRREFRPIAVGHTPANWSTACRWRWATAAERRAADAVWLRDEIKRFAETIPMPTPQREMKMKLVRLLSPNGEDLGSVSIPDQVVGPDTIRRSDMIFVRKTHTIYIEATCCIVPDAAA